MTTPGTSAATELTAGESLDHQGPGIEPVRHKSSHPPPPPSMRTRSTWAHWQRINVGGRPRVAADLMTRGVFTIGKDDTLEHLEEQMQALHFRHLPVVEGQKLIGLITHADLLRVSSTFLSDKARERNELIHKLPARHIMQRDPVTVRPTELLTEVAVVLWEARLGCVPVTEEDGSLVGMITEGDFLRLAHHYLTQELESASPAAVRGS